jgi:DnaK suppressor protein
VERPETEDLVGAVDTDLDGVEAALARLDDDRYGTCVRCGRPLPPADLDDDPLIDHCPAPCGD